MKKNVLYCRENFRVSDGDLLMQFLQEKATQGWKYKNYSPYLQKIYFEKAESKQLYFRWECLPFDEKGGQLRRIRRELIENHRKEGWEFVGEYGAILIFTSEEEKIFEHWGGEKGKCDQVFGWLKKEKIQKLLTAILFGVLLLIECGEMFVAVIEEDYLEWGLSGLFSFMYDNGNIVLLLGTLIMTLVYLIQFINAPSARKGKEIVKQAMEKGQSIFYGEQEEYKNRRNKSLRTYRVSWFFSVCYLLLFLGTAVPVSTPLQMGVIIGAFALVIAVIAAVNKISFKRKWGTVKRVACLSAGFTIVTIIIGFCVTTVDTIETKGKEEERWNAIEEEYSYPPSAFGITTWKDMQWTSEKGRSIFGSVESLDVYHLTYDEENPFDYSYYKYTASNDFVAGILRSQALKNLETYNAKMIEVETEGWSCYRIQWNMNTQQDFYSDTFLLMKGREILLVNCYLENISFEKVLEIFLSSPVSLVI